MYDSINSLNLLLIAFLEGLKFNCLAVIKFIIEVLYIFQNNHSKFLLNISFSFFTGVHNFKVTFMINFLFWCQDGKQAVWFGLSFLLKTINAKIHFIIRCLIHIINKIIIYQIACWMFSFSPQEASSLQASFLQQVEEELRF